MKPPAVKVEHLGFTFAGREAPSLAGVSFSLETKSWTVVTGKTGSGKTTLLRALAGLIPRHTSGQMQGRVSLFGQDTQCGDLAERAGLVGLVQQSPDDQICTTSVSAEIAFGLENLAVPPEQIQAKIDVALGLVSLDDAADMSVRELSGGQKQRLVLASLLAVGPRLLLLDEPLSQLDPRAAADLLAHLNTLRAAGMTIVVAEHRLDDILAMADRVLVLDDGALAADHAADDIPGLAKSFNVHGLRLPELHQLAKTLGHDDARTVADLVSAVPLPARRTVTQPETHQVDNAQRRPLLDVQSLEYRYPGTQQPVWGDVSFRIGQGERVALVGPNGSGKSTLLAALAGLLTPTAGKLQYLLRDQSAEPDCGLVLQNPDLALFCRSVREELAFGPRQFGRRADEINSWSTSAAGAMSVQTFLDEPPQSLSQGERLRTAVAATLSMHPRLLLLDEPTTGQDVGQVQSIMAALCDEIDHAGTIEALLFSTHDLRIVAQHARRVLVLADGRLMADCSPSELLADDRLLDLARLRRPPLYELRQRWQLSGLNVAEMIQELRP